MAIGTAYSSVNMETANIWYGDVSIANANQIQISLDGYVQNYYGSFYYDVYGNLAGGTVSSTNYYEFGNKIYEIGGGYYNALTIESYINAGGQMYNLFSYVFSGDDTLTGSSGYDVIDGFTGNDILNGGAGNDTLNAGSGDDTYWFGIGYGNDTIKESGDYGYYGAGGIDQVTFTGLKQADASFTRTNNGNDLVIKINSTGEKLTIQNNFYDNSWNIESFVFTDSIYQIPVNSPPQGFATAQLTLSEDSSFILTKYNLLQGFSDVDGNTSLSVTNLSVNYGSSSYNYDGNWLFKPDANFNGIVSLTYTVNDNKGGSIAANQSLKVTPVNDAPSGSVFITGNTVKGQTLKATNNISDADGFATAISYQWKANGGPPT